MRFLLKRRKWLKVYHYFRFRSCLVLTLLVSIAFISEGRSQVQGEILENSEAGDSPNAELYRLLFLDPDWRISIRSASADSGKFAFGTPAVGMFFTQSLMDAFYDLAQELDESGYEGHPSPVLWAKLLYFSREQTNQINESFDVAPQNSKYEVTVVSKGGMLASLDKRGKVKSILGSILITDKKLEVFFAKPKLRMKPEEYKKLYLAQVQGNRYQPKNKRKTITAHELFENARQERLVFIYHEPTKDRRKKLARLKRGVNQQVFEMIQTCLEVEKGVES